MHSHVTPKFMNRNTAIDIAKGFGIFLVLWGHTQCDYKSYIYVFHIPLFFLLSGYVFNIADSIKMTFKKKIRSLGIPFLFFLIFQRICFIIIALIDGTFNYSYLLILSPIEPWGHIGVLWFFISLFTVSIIFSIVNKFPSEIFKLIVCLLLTYTGYLLSNRNIHLPFRLDSSFSMIFFFYLGSKLHVLHMDKIKSFISWFFLSLASLILFIFCLNLFLPIIDVSVNIFEGEFLYSLPIMILGCLMIVIFSKLIEHIPYLKTAMAYIGQNSLTIFATHPIILGCIYLVFQKDKISDLGGILIVFFMIGVCLLLTILLQKYFSFVFGRKKIVAVKI